MDARRRTPRLLRGRLQRSIAAGPGRTRSERTARTFLRDQRALLRLADPDVELELTREERDALGPHPSPFPTATPGVPVEPAELLVHLDPRGDVDVVNGSWAPTPEIATPRRRSRADAAVGLARRRSPERGTPRFRNRSRSCGRPATDRRDSRVGVRPGVALRAMAGGGRRRRPASS
jgi:Zn-dependent metalloprotease